MTKKIINSLTNYIEATGVEGAILFAVAAYSIVFLIAICFAAHKKKGFQYLNSFSKNKLPTDLIQGLVLIFVLGLASVLTSELISVSLFILVLGLIFALLSESISGLLNGLFFGLFSGLASGLLSGLLFGALTGIITGLTFALAFGLFFGLKAEFAPKPIQT